VLCTGIAPGRNGRCGPTRVTVPRGALHSSFKAPIQEYGTSGTSAEREKKIGCFEKKSGRLARGKLEWGAGPRGKKQLGLTSRRKRPPKAGEGQDLDTS